MLTCISAHAHIQYSHPLTPLHAGTCECVRAHTYKSTCTHTHTQTHTHTNTHTHTHALSSYKKNPNPLQDKTIPYHRGKVGGERGRERERERESSSRCGYAVSVLTGFPLIREVPA